MADDKNATLAQVAIAWILAQREWIVPIPGTTKANRIGENIKAASIQFSKEELAKIKESVDKLDIVGDRYPQSEQERIGK